MALIGKPYQSIRSRLFLPLLILVLPILIMQAYIFYDRFATRRAEELQSNLELARAVGVAFHGLVQDVIREELTIATAATASPPLSHQDLARLLRQSAESDPAVSRFSWVGPEGRVIASSNPNLVSIDISDREYFKEVVAGREWVVSDLVLSKATGEPVFTISRAARDVEGNFLGMVSATFYPDGLEKILAIKRAEGAAVNLIDHNGMNVARYPRRDHTREQLNWSRFYPPVEDALRGKEIVTTIVSTTTGKKSLAGFVPISPIGWVASASRRQDDAMGDFTWDLLTQGTLFLLVALVSFGTALLVSRQAAASISKLRDQVLALGRGEVQKPLGVSGPSEIVELAETFYKMAEDIRRSGEALRDSENRLRAIFESTEEAIIILNEEQRCLEANPAAGAITGFHQNQMKTRFLLEFLDSSFDLSSSWERLLKTGRFRGEVRIRHRTGTLRIADVFGVARIGPGCHLLVFHDITERQQAEKALVRQRELAEMERIRLQAVLEALPVSIFIADANGKLVATNPAANEIWGQAPLSRQLADYREDYKAWWPATGKRVQSDEWGLARALTKGERCIAEEMEIETPDGRRKIILNYALPILDADRQITGGVAVNVDITQRKQMEEEIRKAKGDLEFRVKERTAELERRNEELQNFTFVASHDLQEPLRKIQTFSDLIITKYSDSVSEQCLDYIRRMAETATGMREVLRSLLNYSHLTSRDQPFERVDLNKVAREIVSDLELEIQAKRALVEIGDLPELEADPSQIEQLLENLLGNALKFSREGIQPKVTIRADCTSQKGQCVICVEDNGIGFEERYLDQIFKPFQRLHGRKEYGGVGMGLAICTKVVENHSGRITARSTLGAGSTFTVTLPATRSERDHKRQEPSKDHPFSESDRVQ